MSLILIHKDRTETIEFPAAFDEYCCLFDEISRTIIKTFNLSNLSSDYHMVYYDPSFSLWINFNIHVTKRITELIRYSTSKTLKIRIERRQINTTTLLLEKKNIDKVEFNKTGDARCAHLIIWLDEHIGNPLWHKQLKRDCRAMINTNTSFITNDNIDIQIQYNSLKNDIDTIRRSNLKYSMKTTTNYLCPFQCAFYTTDNTDIFFEYLNMSLELTRSASIIVSAHFAKEILPIILSRQQKQLLPELLFLYVLCSNIPNYYDWAIGYSENNNIPNTTHLELFDDEKALFVRLLNDIRRHLTSEANTRRDQNEHWHALQYYTAARQLFLNSLPWDPCYTLRELDDLDKLIEKSALDVNTSMFEKFRSYTINDNYSESDDKVAQQCAEISEGI